jgi:hypothetical protein
MTTILNFIDDHVPGAWRLSFMAFLSTLTWLDMVDWVAKIITGIITIVLFVYARKRHTAKLKNLELEREKLEQEIYAQMQKNKGI